MLNENLFAQAWNQIAQQALGGIPNARLQLFSTPESWTWPVPPTGQQSAQAYQAVDAMPAWSPIGSYGTLDADLFTTYKTALSHVGFKVSPTIQEQVTQLRNQMTLDSNAETQALSDMNQAYLAQKQNGGAIFAAKFPTIDAWINAPAGQGYYQAYLDAAATVAKDAETLLELQTNSMPSTLQDAVKATVTPTGNPASDPAPAGWTKVPDGSGVLRWAPDWVIGTTGQDWRAELTSGTVGAFDLHLSADDSSTTYANSWAGGAIDYGQSFFSVFAEGEWSKLDLATSDQSVKVDVSVKSSTLVPVTPGSWYDGGFLRDLAQSGGTGDGWTVAPPWTAKGPPPSLFGTNGLLPTRVSGLLAVYQPSYEITMAASTFEQHSQQFQASGGLQIGPFSLGGEGGHASDYEHEIDGSTTFRGGSTSTDPVLIGVTVAFPGVE